MNISQSVVIVLIKLNYATYCQSSLLVFMNDDHLSYYNYILIAPCLKSERRTRGKDAGIRMAIARILGSGVNEKAVTFDAKHNEQDAWFGRTLMVCNWVKRCK